MVQGTRFEYVFTGKKLGVSSVNIKEMESFANVALRMSVTD